MSNLCLICSQNFTKRKKMGRPWKREERKEWKDKKLKLLVNYLLDSRANSLDNLKKEVVENFDGFNFSKQTLSFCLKCELLSDKLMELQLQLEKAQMEMVNQLKIVREVMGSNGNEGGGEEWLGGWKWKELLRILKEFQDAACLNGKDSVAIPLVYLERCAFIQRKPYSLKTEESVKTEPEDDLANDTGGYEDFEFPTADDLEDTSTLTSFLMTAENISEHKPEISLPKQEVKEEGRVISSKRSSAALELTSLTPNNQVEGEPTPAKRIKGSKKPSKYKKKSKKIKSTTVKKKSHSKIYSCDSCSFSTKGEMSKFEQHLREHETDDKPFQCELCPLAFSTKGHYDFHKDRHQGKHRLVCDICSKWIRAFELREHLITHGDRDLIQCHHCSYCCSSLESYLKHLNNHLLTGPGVPCHICQEQQNSRGEFAKHLHIVHGVLQPIPCDFEGCERKFFLSHSLDIHKVVHTSKFECKECSKRFPSSKYLEVHQLKHAGRKPLKCDQCPEEFSGQRSLRYHQIKEHGAEKFKCDQCGKEYNTMDSLKYHMRMDHDVGGMHCPICNAKFGTNYWLKHHIEAKHSDGTSYVCEECGQCLQSKYLYTAHKRKTHGEKKYKCSFCPKEFPEKHYLESHERSHTGEKPFMCKNCGKSFKQKTFCGIHQRKCESQNPKKQL